MNQWKPALCLAIVILLVVPLHAQERAASDATPQSISTARVADHESLLRIDLGSYLKLVFPANTFSENTAVKAYLDWVLSDAGQCIIMDKGYAPIRDVTCE